MASTAVSRSAVVSVDFPKPILQQVFSSTLIKMISVIPLINVLLPAEAISFLKKCDNPAHTLQNRVELWTHIKDYQDITALSFAMISAVVVMGYAVGFFTSLPLFWIVATALIGMHYSRNADESQTVLDGFRARMLSDAVGIRLDTAAGAAILGGDLRAVVMAVGLGEEGDRSSEDGTTGVPGAGAVAAS